MNNNNEVTEPSNLDRRVIVDSNGVELYPVYPDVNKDLTEDNDMPIPGLEETDIFKEKSIAPDPVNPIEEHKTPDVPKNQDNFESVYIEEEVFLIDEDNNSNKSESININTEPPKISELINLDDFELVIKKDNIDLTNLKDEDIKFETVNIPNNTNKEILNFVDVGEDGTPIGEAMKDKSNGYHLVKLQEEAKNREVKGVHEVDNNENYFNAAEFKGEDKNVKMHPSFIKTATKNTDNASLFLDSISKATNADVVISVPLYNSGIWIGIQSPSEPEIIQLQMLAVENEIKLGASTAGLVYSNYSVLFRKYALDLAFSNIKYASVKVDNLASSLKKLISIDDEETILMALSAAMYPTGVDRMITCANFLRSKDACTHTVQAKLHFDRLLFPDYGRLTDNLILHMSKKSPNSTTIAEVEEYQSQIAKYKESIKIYTLPDGSKVTVEYKTPNIEEGIMQGEYWVEKINMLVNNIITGSGNKPNNIADEMMKIYIDSAMRTNLLGLYLHFIKSITINNRKETNYRIINEALTALTKVDNIANLIMSDIVSLIKKSSLTIVGHTQYVCPKCKELNDNATVEDGHPFKKIVPFNVLGVLFILGSLKYSTVILRKE